MGVIFRIFFYEILTSFSFRYIKKYKRRLNNPIFFYSGYTYFSFSIAAETKAVYKPSGRLGRDCSSG